LSVCSLARYTIACELIKFSTGNLPSSALTPFKMVTKNQVNFFEGGSMHLKLDIKKEITEKYKYLYKSKKDKIDESSKLFFY
jgi:hypothetical protein